MHVLRRLSPGFLVWLFGIAAAFCADVRLKSGVDYSGVEIIARTYTDVTLKTKFGYVQIPLSYIATIDGASVEAAPSATPAPALATPPAVKPSEPEAEAWSETAAKTTEISAGTPEQAPVFSAAPPSAQPAVANEAPDEARKDYYTAGKWTAYAVLFWIVQLVWIRRGLAKRFRAPGKWLKALFFLPGIGLVSYLFSPNRPSNRAAANALEPAGFSSAGENLSPQAAKPPSKWTFWKRTPRKLENKPKGLGLRFLDHNHEQVVEPASSGDSTTLETARQILEAAIIERASDIHIEPREQDYRIRFRVDGQLSENRLLESSTGKRLVATLKSLAQIDISEKRRAQDGRFQVRTDERGVDFRMATANSIFGEKVVLRILDRQGGIMSLDQVGMSPAMEAAFDRAIHSRSGIIIVTGPTGSGKTSTLYAALSRLDRTRLNIMTIEDPVEYELNGATQIPVLPKAGVTYETGLRSILRQDPDVILVGEMRDAEAATIAIRAALTGHLVFTSLHTRDSISTLVRLEEMGMDRSQMASALLMLVAQRLVRLVCTGCRIETPATGAELYEIGLELPVGSAIYEACPTGCRLCEGTGYRGRTAIFELLVFDDELRQAVVEGAGDEAIYAMAYERGFRIYREDGAQKVLAGLTTAAEVLEAA